MISINDSISVGVLLNGAQVLTSVPEKYFRSGIGSLGFNSITYLRLWMQWWIEIMMQNTCWKSGLFLPLRGSDDKMDPLSVYCTNTWQHHSISLCSSQAKRLPLILLEITHLFVHDCVMMIGTSLIQWLFRIQRGWRSCWACVPPDSSSTVTDFASTASPGPKSSRSPTNAITSTSRSVPARWEHHHVFSRWPSQFWWSFLTRERLFVSSLSSLKAR